MDSVLGITKAPGDRQRLWALAALRSGEPCLCKLVALLRPAFSTVSNHKAVLVHAEPAVPACAACGCTIAVRGRARRHRSAVRWPSSMQSSRMTQARHVMRAPGATRRTDMHDLSRCHKQRTRHRTAGGTSIQV